MPSPSEDTPSLPSIPLTYIHHAPGPSVSHWGHRNQRSSDHQAREKIGQQTILINAPKECTSKDILVPCESGQGSSGPGEGIAIRG